MDCLHIVNEYLKANGYDGLRNSDGGCACKVDDLLPRDEACNLAHCEPGYLAPCPSECGEHDWHIVPLARRGGEVGATCS